MAHQYSPEQIAKRNSLTFLKTPEAKEKLPTKYGISIEQLQQVEQRIKGKIVYPWSPTYNMDRKDFNNVYEAYPVMIVYAVCHQDIRECLALANGNNPANPIWTSIRSGGHSLAGYSVCDGIVIDMSKMDNVYVDVAQRKAYVDAGTSFQKLFPILEQNGMHMPGGGCPSVCVAGYMQGGGYGLTSRMYGMQCDLVSEVTVMKADGSIVIANKDQNEDLLWAVCGGTGGNFGVLLSIVYDLHPLGDIYGVKLSWQFENGYENAASALETIQNNYLQSGQYPNLGIETILCRDFSLKDPNDPGKRTVFFCSTWIGNEADYQKALEPLMNLPGTIVTQPVFKGPYTEVNETVLEGTPNLPPGIKAYSQSTYIARNLSIGDWTSILEFFSTAPNRYAMVDMECYGGAINEVPLGTNSFIHRNVNMDFFCDAFFTKQTDDQKANEVWLQEFFNFLKTYSNGHSYQNYPNRLQEDFKWAYWGDQYPRLEAIKKKYDPNNFFRYQQSIGEGLNS